MFKKKESVGHKVEMPRKDMTGIKMQKPFHGENNSSHRNTQHHKGREKNILKLKECLQLMNGRKSEARQED